MGHTRVGVEVRGVEGGAGERLVLMKRRSHFIDVGAVGADGLMELVAGGVELFGPVGDVGCELGVDDVGVVRADGMLLVGCVRRVFLRLLLVLYGFVFGHGYPLLRGMWDVVMGMYG